MNQQHKIRAKDLSKELTFSASKSSGPGGQHVNKVNTKVTLRFDVAHSEFLSQDEKEIIIKKLASKINHEGVLALSAQNSRSQLKNKEEVIQKLDRLLIKAFTKKKVRKPTKPTHSAVRKRLDNKKKLGEKKKSRKIPKSSEPSGENI